MKLWEQNKPLVIIAGVFVLLILVMRPNIFSAGPVVARWFGASWKAKYDAAEYKRLEVEDKISQYYTDGGQDITTIMNNLQRGNARMSAEFDTYVRDLSFVPYRPFLPPDVRERPEREWGHYFRQVLTETRDQLHQYCSARFVTMSDDLGFGELDRSGTIPAGQEVPGLLRELAVSESFVKLCADAQISNVEVLAHRQSRKNADGGRAFITEYPVQVHLRGSYLQLSKLLDGMKGKHVQIKSVEVNELRDTVEMVTLGAGKNANIKIGDEFTVFKQSDKKPCELVYAGRITVTAAFDEEAVAQVNDQCLPYELFDTASRDSRRIKPGDFASTGFFRVIKFESKAIQGKIEQVDREGIPTKVTPHLLDVNMDIATYGFDVDTERVTPENIAKYQQGGRIYQPAEGGGAKPAGERKPATRARRSY